MDLSTQENISMTATESTEDHLSTSRPDIAPDPTDFSDTTESDAEKHASKENIIFDNLTVLCLCIINYILFSFQLI